MVKFSAHFMPMDGRVERTEELPGEREADLAFIESESVYLAAFAYQQFVENGRGCVKVSWAEVEIAALTAGTLPSRVFLDFIPPSPDSVLPESEAAQREAEARCDDRLRFWLDILIYAYDPETEYGVLIVKDGGPHRLYRVQPEAFAPKAAAIKEPYGLN